MTAAAPSSAWLSSEERCETAGGRGGDGDCLPGAHVSDCYPCVALYTASFPGHFYLTVSDRIDRDLPEVRRRRGDSIQRSKDCDYCCVGITVDMSVVDGKLRDIRTGYVRDERWMR